MPEIPLWNRAGQVVASCKVDDDDYERIAARRWHLNAGYARTATGNDSAVSMHRMVMGLEPGDGLEVDHISRDKLDNRKANLRVGTQNDNAKNRPAMRGSTSRFRGVSRHTARGMWRAGAMFNKRDYWLGVHATEEDAAAAVERFWAERGY